MLQLISKNLFQIVFTLAAVISAYVTFFAVSNLDPLRPFEGAIRWVFLINTLLIVVLAVLFIRRYRDLQIDRDHQVKRRLVSRFLLLICLSSILPTSIVAASLGGTIYRDLNTWFGTRVGTIVEETASLAKTNVDEISLGIEERTRQVALRLNFQDTAAGLTNNQTLYEEYLGRQALIFGFRAAYIVTRQGEAKVTGYFPAPLPYNPPMADAQIEADLGLVAQTLYEQASVVTSLVKLDYPDWAYLYLVGEVNAEAFARLRQAEQSVLDYRQAEASSTSLQALFAIGYVQILALALLLFGRLGLETGNQIVRPLIRLSKAAEKVKAGDLTTQVALPGTDDEVDRLTQSFNTMIAQLASQRSALITSQGEAEGRRQFLETLLSQVSAGVIRTDSDMRITLANASAEALIEQVDLQGALLGDVLPEFEPYAQKAIEADLASDISLEIKRHGETRHMRLRTVADAQAGCVLTFDDATRMVSAQRHMAWRDVARRVAHEIRNPLTPIQLAAERLHRRYRDQIPDDDKVFEQSLETIKRKVTDIGHMVNEFSSFARLPKPDIRPFNLISLLEDTVFSQKVVSPDIRFDLKTRVRDLIYYGDERLLGQAFLNLIKNAAEAIESHPIEDEIQGRIEIDVIAEANTIRLTICDNGPGFPEDIRSQLLEPYVTTRQNGTGLGLAIVNRILIDHGGQIYLQAREDNMQGAKVSIVLPVQGGETGSGVSNSEDDIAPMEAS